MLMMRRLLKAAVPVSRINRQIVTPLSFRKVHGAGHDHLGHQAGAHHHEGHNVDSKGNDAHGHHAHEPRAPPPAFVLMYELKKKMSPEDFQKTIDILQSNQTPSMEQFGEMASRMPEPAKSEVTAWLNGQKAMKGIPQSDEYFDRDLQRGQLANPRGTALVIDVNTLSEPSIKSHGFLKWYKHTWNAEDKRGVNFVVATFILVILIELLTIGWHPMDDQIKENFKDLDRKEKEFASGFGRTYADIK